MAITLLEAMSALGLLAVVTSRLDLDNVTEACRSLSLVLRFCCEKY
jgi:hypothetical protein